MTRQPEHDLADFLEGLETPISPQAAQRLAATEQALREMEEKYGLHTEKEVQDLLGAASAPDIASMNQRGELLGFTRRGQTLYPGFQFKDGAVLPVIPRLTEIARRYEISSSGLAQWLCEQTGQLDDQRPVDHLDQTERIAEATENHYGVEW